MIGPCLWHRSNCGELIRKSILKTLFVAGLVMVAANGLAFHDGGVAECAGCHTMHNSQDGALVDPEAPGGHAYLLKAGSATDQCLTYHASYRQFAGGTGYGAGGDFYWVTRTFSWSAHGRTTISEGDSHSNQSFRLLYGTNNGPKYNGGPRAPTGTPQGEIKFHAPFRPSPDSSLGLTVA